jgi:hypothetical protein
MVNNDESCFGFFYRCICGLDPYFIGQSAKKRFHSLCSVYLVRYARGLSLWARAMDVVYEYMVGGGAGNEDEVERSNRSDIG